MDFKMKLVDNNGKDIEHFSINAVNNLNALLNAQKYVVENITK